VARDPSFRQRSGNQLPLGDLFDRSVGYRGNVSEQLHLTIRYSDAGDGWVTAQIAEIPGAISQGESREQAKANVLNALELLLTPDEQLAGEQDLGDSESLTLSVG
jgi:predicted RNase H-like HicB family nuclease